MPTPDSAVKVVVHPMDGYAVSEANGFVDGLPVESLGAGTTEGEDAIFRLRRTPSRGLVDLAVSEDEGEGYVDVENPRQVILEAGPL